LDIVGLLAGSIARRLARHDSAEAGQVYAGIGRLIVVDVTLDRVSDDPQMIFESLNSTGVDLTQADLIRNYILMRVAEPLQTHLYETYWRKIEDLFRDAGRQFDAFARDYMALMTRASKQARGDVIYHSFRDFFRDREAALGVEGALGEMLRYARHHAAFSLGRGVTGDLAAAMDRLNRLAEVAAILVMRLAELQEAGALPERDFVDALGLLESYVFRRSVCGMQTRNYWQTFSSLAYRLRAEAPLKSLNVALHRQRETARFPRDEEFMVELQTRDIYSMRTVHYLLDRLENHANKEPVDTSSYTVEHILPQNENLPRPWREMLGENWQAVQQTWVHRLGNLTLTGYNPTYSDRPFEEKKSIEGGFNDSSVRLNKFVREQAAWTDKEIATRGEALARRAIDIWPRPTVAEADLRLAEQDDLRARASRRRIEDVPMTSAARALFEKLRPLVRSLSDGIVEMPEEKSIVYHAADGDFFLEVLPRKHRLVLLLNLDYADCDHADDRLRDAVERDFFVHAKNEGGVYYRIKTDEDVDRAMRFIRQAHEAAAL
jgi:predicted transport protein